jgi:DNA-binding MarR family transcriptional regulator
VSADRNDSIRVEPRTTYLVGRLDRLLRRRLGDALSPYGLTLAEYTALSVLARRGGLSNAQLARRTLITPQSMNEVLGRLVERRLVRRSAHPAHGRVIETAVTAAGRRTLANADAAVEAVEAQMLAGVGAADRQRLLRALAGCIDALAD